MKHARKSRRICPACQQRPAKFATRGHVKRDRQHVLCFACHRALINSHRLAHPLPFMLNLPTNGHVAVVGERAVAFVSVPIPAIAAR